MSNGILGGLFDFNGDGNLDAFEQGLEYMFLDEMSKKSNDEDETEEDLKMQLSLFFTNPTAYILSCA